MQPELRLRKPYMLRVSWDDIDRSAKPGTYFVQGGNVTVRDRDIEIWRDHPDAVFETVWYRHPDEKVGSHRLVSWEAVLL